MKSFLALTCLLSATAAFQRSFPSSFTGRVTSVCARQELNTELSCPPSLTSSHGRTVMSMPPFLKKLRLRKPKNPIFGGGKTEDEEDPSSSAVAVVEPPTTADVRNATVIDETKEEEEISETDKLLQQVKDSGLAGVISYALWELGFWTVSIPVCIFGYREVTGHWPDLQNAEDLEKLGAEAFAFVNFARFAVPLRIGLALSTTPWIQSNIVDRFMHKDDQPVTANGSTSEDATNGASE